MIHEKLLAVQTELKAPKNQHNKFGGFNYRSCEDILEAVKPHLKANNATLTVNDEIVQIGERYYVKATAVFSDIDGVEKIENTAYAREEEVKKGMDSSQVTGATSSYARKYALNGLFLIDDTKDADTDYHAEQRKKADNEAKNKAMTDEINKKMIDDAKVEAIRSRLEKKALTNKQYATLTG